MTRTSHFLIVPATVNASPDDFVLDTGSQATVITEAASTRLALSSNGAKPLGLTGVGGQYSLPSMQIDSLIVGGLPLHRTGGRTGNSIYVGNLRDIDTLASSPIGILGQDYLAGFDLDIDAAHGFFSLLSVSHCPAFSPWPGYAIKAIRRGPLGLVFPVTVDGQPLEALLDSAAQGSVILASGTAKLNLDSACRDVMIQGVGQERPMGCHHKVTLGIGPETLRDFQVVTTSIPLGDQADMIIGTDWLQDRHVWISMATNRLLVAQERRG